MFGTRNVNIDKFGSAEDPDLVYYNCDIINGKDEDEGVGTSPLLRYSETRDTSIIKDCSKYYFSIVRYSMNGSDILLPMFVPRIQLGSGQTNPNLTIYTASLEVDVDISGKGTNTFRSTRSVEWSPQIDGYNSPISPAGGFTQQSLETPYYYCMNYDHWIRLVNQTFELIWNDINTAYKSWYGAGATDLSTHYPVMKYNPDTQRFSLYCDTVGYGGESRSSKGTANDENWSIYFNSNMYGLFKGFPNMRLGGDRPTSNTKGLEDYAYEILTEDATGLNRNIVSFRTATDATIPNSPSYFEITQDYISTGTLWSPIASLVFVSTLIPIYNEQTGEPVSFGASNSSESIGSKSAFQPIITDIALFNENAHVYKEFVQYVPSAEYRLSTMSNSRQEVRSIDIQVYWKNRLDNQLYPVYLFNQSSISVKIMFRRRDFNLSTYK